MELTEYKDPSSHGSGEKGSDLFFDIGGQDVRHAPPVSRRALQAAVGSTWSAIKVFCEACVAVAKVELPFVSRAEERHDGNVEGHGGVKGTGIAGNYDVAE